jgi:hypothetical protein
VQPRTARVADSLRPRVDVLARGAAERGHGRALERAGNGADALEVPGRRRGEAGFDDVNAEALELVRDLGLFVRLQRDRRRLLAVAKRGVEDCDPARTHGSLPRASSDRRRTGGG